MSIPKRLWRILRSEVNHRFGNFDTAEHRAFRAAWEEAERETQFDEDVVGESSAASELERHYKVLGLASDATFAEVRVVYKRLVKEHHPDNFQSEAEVKAATVRFQEINAAYSAIKASQ